MASASMELYIHIPFCRQKCLYCDFCSIATNNNNHQIASYCRALCEEIKIQAPFYQKNAIASVFIGGGTPSILPIPYIKNILETLQHHFEIGHGIEFTCEANPGTITPEFIALLNQYNINRLSLGAQAYQSHLLHMLGRIHDWQEVIQSINIIKSHGIHNINIDLMFGLPGQSLAHWQETLRQTITLQPTHISAYGLIIEPGTPIEKKINNNTLALPPDELEREMYDASIKILKEAGYEQYEISNFALAGYECQHNIGYWQGRDYLGMGLAAHSKLSPMNNNQCAYERLANTNKINTYIQAIGQKELPIESRECISHQEAMFETMMTGLRMTRGVSNISFTAQHGISIHQKYGEKLKPLINKDLLRWEGPMLFLTRKGMDIQNQILITLMDD